jgi:3'-5' exoribonuclease
MTIRRRPREFCAECFPWPAVSELAEGDEVVACYLVHDRRLSQTRQSKQFLDLRLGDRSGTIAGKVWEDAVRFDSLCAPDTFVGVRGRVDVFRDQLQLRVNHLEPLHVQDEDLGFFLPASPLDHAEMCSELDMVIRSVRDRPLAALLRRCLGPATTAGRAFRVHPAAKRNHHAYVGGLLEHSLSVAAMCDRIATHFVRQGARIDRDLLVAGALLHDIGKVQELSGGYSIAYTDAGQLLGHILLGIGMVSREAESVARLPPERLLLLQHLIASHQGKPEWESPKAPQMVEALILHYADDLDAKLNPALRMLSGVTLGAWSEYDPAAGRRWFQPPELDATAEVEAVPPAEALGVVIDLFRG